MLDEKRMKRNLIWLQAERERVQRELRQLQSAVAEGERPGYSTHMADDASAVFEQARDLALTQRLRYTLAQVERALDKMQNGTYAVCDRCGQEIDPARLKALPHATLCKPCQERAELGPHSH